MEKYLTEVEITRLLSIINNIEDNHPPTTTIEKISCHNLRSEMNPYLKRIREMYTTINAKVGKNVSG